LKIPRDCRNAEDQDEEVEGIERPAQKARCECVTLVRAQAPEGARHE